MFVQFEPSIFHARRRALRVASRNHGPGEAGAYGFESLRLRQPSCGLTFDAASGPDQQPRATCLPEAIDSIVKAAAAKAVAAAA
jgi:hypothetical protein